MAMVRWLNGSGGNWSATSDWSGGVGPASTDEVLIDAVATGAGGYTLSVDASDAASSLAIAAAARVRILAGNTLSLAGGTGTGTNNGTLVVGDGAALAASGTFDNAGQVALQGNTSVAALQVSSALTLTGNGSVDLTGAGTGSQITAAAAGGALVNVGNTISGAGLIGGGDLGVDNRAGGVIDATGTERLTLDTAGTFTNEGLLEATSGGGLLIAAGVTIVNTGTILANGANVYLDGSVLGGTLTSQSGSLDVEGGNTASLTNVTLTAGSLLVIEDSATLDVQTALSNAGTVDVGGASSGPLLTQSAALTSGTTPVDGGVPTGSAPNSAGSDATQVTGDEATSQVTPQAAAAPAQLSVASAVVTLSGHGAVQLGSGNSHGQIGAAHSGNALVNADNTITGGGLIGAGGLAMDNQSAGVINATAASRMTIESTGRVTNEGLIESTAGGGLQISGGTTISGPGSIMANGANVFLDGATISGGTLGGTLGGTGGAFVLEEGNSSILAGATIEAGTTIKVGNNATLTLGSDIRDFGTIELSGPNARLILGGTVLGAALGARFLAPNGGATLAATSFTPGIESMKALVIPPLPSLATLGGGTTDHVAAAGGAVFAALTESSLQFPLPYPQS